MLPDFNRLKIFYFIYDAKSVVAAAKELNITQSAVSQHLGKLETELKIPLFTRLHKKMIPTTAGDRLFKIIQPFVKDLSLGLQNIKQEQESPRGLLKIGAPVELGKAFLPGVFASFRTNYPDVNFHLKLGDAETLLPLVEKAELDFAFADMLSLKENPMGEFGPFGVDQILEEEVVLACSKKYYHAFVSENQSYKDLQKLDYIAYTQSAIFVKAWFKHHFNKIPHQLKMALTVESHQAVVAGIVQNMGLGIVGSHFVWDLIQSGEIICLNTDQPKMINRISLIQLLNKMPTITEKKFIAHCKHQIQQTKMFHEASTGKSS